MYLQSSVSLKQVLVQMILKFLKLKEIIAISRDYDEQYGVIIFGWLRQLIIHNSVIVIRIKMS